MAFISCAWGDRQAAASGRQGDSVKQLALDVAHPLLKHTECDFGVVEPRILLSGYNGPGPGVYSAANIRVYSGEGALIGLLTWRTRGSDVWDVTPAAYPPAGGD